MKTTNKKSLKNGFLKDKYNKLMKDSLYKNSIYLMISSGIMAAFGFFFWLICARLFTANDIGLATTIISVMGLITSIAGLGLSTGLIRYLPRAKDKNNKINTCFTLVALLTIIVSSIFLLGLEKFSPKLIFIKENILMSFAFIFFMVIYSSSIMIESVFVAFRSAKFVLVKNTIFSVIKLILPFIFFSLGIMGAFGIFSAYMTAAFIGFGVVFFILIYKFHYRPKLVFYDNVITKIGKFSFVLYLAGFIGGLAAMLMPLVITNTLNPEMTAYYFMAMQIVNLLFVIPNATTNSLFAEGSASTKNLKKNIIKSTWIISILLIPAILLTFLFGHFILGAFGKEYSLQGLKFLKIMSLSAILVSVNAVFSSIFKIKKMVWAIMIRSIISSAVILSLSFILLKSHGLMGIAYAYLVGQFVTGVTYLTIFIKKKDKIEGKKKKSKK